MKDVNVFDIVALRKFKKLAMRVVGKAVISSKNGRQEASFEYGFTRDNDFFHKDGQVSLSIATGINLPWGDMNVTIKNNLGLIGTKEVLESKKTKINDWAAFTPPIETFIKALHTSDEKLAMKVVNQLQERFEFDQVIGMVNWSIPRLVYTVREKLGKKHFQEIYPEQLLPGMVEALPVLNRKTLAEKLASDPSLKAKIPVELIKSMMAVPSSLLKAGVHDVSFKDAGNRYFTHSPCGANERMSSADFAKYKSGQAVTISCPRCFYQGVISHQTEATKSKPAEKKVDEKIAVAPSAEAKTEADPKKPAQPTREEQEVWAKRFNNLVTVGIA